MIADINETIGENFYKTRAELRLSLRGMGELIGVSHQTISNIEKATYPIKHEWLRELAARDDEIGSMARRCITAMAASLLQEVSHVD